MVGFEEEGGRPRTLRCRRRAGENLTEARRREPRCPALSRGRFALAAPGNLTGLDLLCPVRRGLARSARDVVVMRCAACGFENPAGMKFCGQGGAALDHRCASCGFENPSQFKFCGQCGTPLGTPLAVHKSRRREAAPAAATE